MNKKTIAILAALTLGGAGVANAATPAPAAKTQTAKPKHVVKPAARHVAAKKSSTSKQPG